MFIHKIATAAVVALLASASLAIAQPARHSEDVSSIRVSTAGIDVHSQAGANRLLARVRAAASAICGDKPDARDLQRSAMFGVCLSGTVDRAVVTSGMPSLTAANGGSAIIVQASR